MRRPHVGFYVHYHGMGHKQRTEAILAHLSTPATVLSSRTRRQNWNRELVREVVDLACDNDDVHQESLASAAQVPTLHFAPLWCDNITRRVRQYTHWLDTARPDLMVVDVSVEISLLTRLASIPQIVMRQHGRRDDPAHLNAYAAAVRLLAPFPKTMEDSITPQWVQDKTVYLDGFCNHQSGSQRVSVRFDRPTIVVMFGRGGRGDPQRRLSEAAQAVPAYQWVVVGKEGPGDETPLPPNLRFVGWVGNASAYLHAADVVVTAAGHNSVMEAGRARARFIAIAEPRPFDEQRRKAAVLQQQQLAIGLEDWPPASQWSGLIDRAKHLDPSRWDAIYKGDGAAQAAACLDHWAAWSQQQRLQGTRIQL